MACNKPFAKYNINTASWDLIPCGYCAGCKKDKVTMWTMRVNAEVLQYKNVSTFLTLTYDDDHVHMLPDWPMYTLDYSDSTQFWKSYRYFNAQKKNLPFKYLLTGEYGYKGERALLGGNPHFHCLVLGHEPDYVEELCKDAWTKGFNYPLPLLDGGTRYVCKYIDKQVSIKTWNRQCFNVRPALRCSQGIGVKYFLDHMDKIRADGGIYDKGVLRPIPKYYLDKFEIEIAHSPEYVAKISHLTEGLSRLRLDNSSFVSNTVVSSLSDNNVQLDNLQREYNLLWQNTRRTRLHEKKTD